MSHVSTTAHYGFPIYGDVDIINPLTDFNDCNTAIDNKLYEVAQGTAGVVTDITDVKNQLGSETLDTASQSVTGAINELKAGEDALDTRVVASETDVATLQAQMATATTNISNLGTSVAGLQTEMAGKASATALQTLTTKVGTGNLDTQAQNCVDAINEVLSKIPAGGSVLAEDVVYSNTTSGLTATDVQGAIDEIVSDGAGGVAYDNTASGLSATNVQQAIDEIASGGGSSTRTLLWSNPNPTSSFSAQNISLSSADYDELVWYIKTVNDVDKMISMNTLKGFGTIITMYTGTSRSRDVTRIDDTNFTIADAHEGSNVSNSRLIPYAIYGIKY